MMRYLLVLVTACSFSPALAVDPGSAADDDGGSATGSDGGSDHSPQPLDGCHVVDPTGLLLCLDFENPDLSQGKVVDLAGHPARSEQVGAMPRDGQQAAVFASTNAAADTPIVVDDAANGDLNIIGDYTIEMWMLRTTTTYTWGARNTSQLGAGLTYGKPFCYGGNNQWADAPASAAIPTGAFHHIACVKRQDELRLYVDGVRVACERVTMVGPLENTAMVFGAGMVGGIDDIHIYARALDSDELARLADTTPAPDPASCD